MISFQSLYPTTLEEAVEFLKSKLPKSAVVNIKSASVNELDTIHFEMGILVRNKLGLSKGVNKALIEDVGCHNADDASAFIIWSLWNELTGAQ